MHFCPQIWAPPLLYGSVTSTNYIRIILIVLLWIMHASAAALNRLKATDCKLNYSISIAFRLSFLPQFQVQFRGFAVFAWVEIFR